MQCSEYKEQISAYIDDELSKKEIKQLLRHLESCSECKEELTKYTLQKEKIASFRASYPGPVPSINFSQEVMEKIEQEGHYTKIAKPSLAISDFLRWFPYHLIKKPALAISFSLLIIIGFTALNLLGVLPNKKHQKERLMSVYELRARNLPSENIKVADLEKEGESTVFHHMVYSSTETFATNPCLLEYAAYTSSPRSNY